MPTPTSRRITARDLLYGFLELRRLTPALNEWTDECLAANPEGTLRLYFGGPTVSFVFWP